VPVPDQQELAGFISQNPDVARWTAELERQRAAVSLSDAGALPDVTIGGGPRYYNDTEETAFVMGVTVPFPVFNRNQGERKEARFKNAKAEDDRRAALLKAATELGRSYQELESAYLTAVALRDTALPAAESAHSAALEGYREGKCGYLQVLDSQRTLFEVKREFVTALADYHKAKTELERLTGQNIPLQQ
jgi:cobalt-zinc-cadmium efflux system outer membrane protein